MILEAISQTTGLPVRAQLCVSAHPVMREHLCYPSSGLGSPHPIFANDGVCEDDEFPGDSDQRHLLGLSLCDKSRMEHLHAGVEPRCRERPKEQRSSCCCSSRTDASLADAGTTFSRVGRESGESGDLFCGQSAKLAQVGDQRMRDNRADAGDRLQENGPPGEGSFWICRSIAASSLSACAATTLTRRFSSVLTIWLDA
jgi:hypothetical protein